MTQTAAIKPGQDVPYSQEAEEAVIGAVLVDSSAFGSLAVFLRAADFYITRHAAIWEAFGRIVGRNDKIDYLTVQEELRALGRLSEIGGFAYLAQLMNSTPTSMHAEVYGRIVERAAIRRRLLVTADKIKALALDEQRPVEAVLADSDALLAAASERHEPNVVLGRYSTTRYTEIEADIQARLDRGELVAYPTPPEWGRLHAALPSVYPGKTLVISGSSGAGKSALCEQFAEHLADQGLRVGYFHTEMTDADMLMRRMARISGVSFDRLATLRLSERERQLRQDADAYIRATFGSRLDYHYVPDPVVSRLLLAMRRAAEDGTQVFVLDHFQDLKPDAALKGQNEIRQFEYTVMWLNAFAEKRNVLVIIASQENDEGKTAWTRKLVQKAVYWISIRRPRLTSEVEWMVGDTLHVAEKGELTPFPELFVNKARLGKTGKYTLFYDGGRFRYLDSAAARRLGSTPAKTLQMRDYTESGAQRAAGGDE